MDHDELAVQLSDLAHALQQRHSPQETLDEIVRSAVGTVPGAEHAGVSMIHGRQHVRTVAATGDLVEKVDHAQYDVGRGPCLEALYEHTTVRVPDLGNEARWGDFTDRAHELGVRSMLSFQLFVTGDNLGALNLYSTVAAAFDDESDHVGQLFASHASVALAAVQEQQNLERAVLTRDLIGQAKGILMERYKLTGDQAFSLLVRASQKTNTKIRDLADHLVRSGELPR
jgi:GAF domain-containing protein